jgi:5-methylcytosine-specific restriction protein A
MDRPGRSAAATIYRRWYRTTAWRLLRAGQLGREPWCRMCARIGRTTPATIVDHVEPHRGDHALFFDPSNLQSLCAPHHDATKQRAEHGRVTLPIGADGWPI